MNKIITKAKELVILKTSPHEYSGGSVSRIALNKLTIKITLLKILLFIIINKI